MKKHNEAACGDKKQVSSRKRDLKKQKSESSKNEEDKEEEKQPSVHTAIIHRMKAHNMPPTSDSFYTFLLSHPSTQQDFPLTNLDDSFE